MLVGANSGRSKIFPIADIHMEYLCASTQIFPMKLEKLHYMYNICILRYEH